MSKYDFKELEKKYNGKSFMENLEMALKNGEDLELRWYYIQKKKMNKEKNKDNYFFEHESNEKCKITLTNPKHFFVMNMKKNGEDFGINPVNWTGDFIKAKFVGSVIVGGKKINQKFKIVEVDLENEELDKLEDLCFGYDDLFKTLNNVRKSSIWFKEGK